MKKDLSDFRKSYNKNDLIEGNFDNDPFKQFQSWFEELERNNFELEINAMSLSTIGEDGFPKSRIVLLKEFSKNGFVFYTNYTSEKAKSILENSKVCLSFFWPHLERQVIIKGIAYKVDEKTSNDYFVTRPRGSQLGAWASNQSSKIESREVLEDALNKLEAKYENKEIPKPEFWGGFKVEPISFEFWQGRPNRLHDRILFEKILNNWSSSRLAP